MLYPQTSGRMSVLENGNFLFGYDTSNKKRISLNKNLRDLLLLTDGKKSNTEIAEEISKKYKVSEKEAQEKVDSTLDKLKQDGFIEYSNKPETKSIRYRQYDFKFPLFSSFIEVTKKCNLRCNHCYNESSLDFGEGLEKKVLFDVIDQIDKIGNFNVFFTGGEPYQRVDFPEVLSYAHEKGMETGVLTNGTLLNERERQRLAEINPKFVAISLESLDSSKYKQIRNIDNKKVIDNILDLKDKGVNVRINTVLFNGLNDSYEDIKKLFEFAKENGFDRDFIAIDEFLEIGRGSKFKGYSIKDKKQVTERIKQISSEVFEEDFSNRIFYSDNQEKDNNPGSFCGLGESIFYLTHEGEITLCTVLNDKKFSAGNILENSVKDIWEKSPLFDYFRKRKHLKDSECEECEVLPNCGGGCKAKPVMLEGVFNKPDLWACSFYNHNS